MMVESEHNARFMTRHVMKYAFTSNLHKINNANWGNTVAINNKALSMPRSEHQSCRFISKKVKCIKSAMKILRHG